jgi:hypothetical protein
MASPPLVRLLTNRAASIPDPPTAKDLITHLLCVDPAQRYTIDEFLQHEWCMAAPAPPTPAIRHAGNAPLDSPLLQSHMRGDRDGRSPGLSTLKEAFDITYAVHRMEEEGAHRRGRIRDRQAGGVAGGRWLPGLNEEDEGEDDERIIQEAKRRHGEVDILDGSIKRKGERRGDPHTKKAGKAGFDGRAGQRDLGRKLGTPFELDMQSATLLGRRHKMAAAGPGGLGSPLSQAPLFADMIDAPQSPMHIT